MEKARWRSPDAMVVSSAQWNAPIWANTPSVSLLYTESSACHSWQLIILCTALRCCFPPISKPLFIFCFNVKHENHQQLKRLMISCASNIASSNVESFHPHMYLLTLLAKVNLVVLVACIRHSLFLLLLSLIRWVATIPVMYGLMSASFSTSLNSTVWLW